MGVYIRGMEMPKSCMDCAARHGAECWLEKCAYIPNYHDGRPEWCPLVPVQPHGDLISRETAKLYHSYLVDERTDIRVPAIPLSVLNVIPTIIPAEPPKEE